MLPKLLEDRKTIFITFKKIANHCVIYSCSAQLIYLKSIAFMVCEHECMNMPSKLYIELVTVLTIYLTSYTNFSAL